MIKKYIDTDNYSCEEHYDWRGRLHRQNEPAKIVICDGVIIKKEYWQCGQLHNENGPAVIGKYVMDVSYDGIKYTANWELYYKTRKISKIETHRQIYSLITDSFINVFNDNLCLYFIRGKYIQEEKFLQLQRKRKFKELRKSFSLFNYFKKLLNNFGIIYRKS